MPGELRRTAICPCCGYGLICIVDTSNTEQVRREYFHAKGSPKARRKRRCVRIFTDHAEAASERKALEVVAHYGRRPVPMPNCKPSAARRRARAKRLGGR